MTNGVSVDNRSPDQNRLLASLRGKNRPATTEELAEDAGVDVERARTELKVLKGLGDVVMCNDGHWGSRLSRPPTDTR